MVSHLHRSGLSTAVGIALWSLAGTVAAAQGPSSSQTPYITPTATGWQITSLVSVGDSPKNGGYPMAGIPDGLGAVPGRFHEVSGDYIADRAYMTVFMNHELRPGSGAVRAHGQNGAFVSQWTVHLNSLTATRGEDLIHAVKTWNPATMSFADTTGTTQFNRFCSADLPPKSAFFNSANDTGFDGLIFMNGEEAGSEGRAFAHVVSGDEKGTSYELPYLGKFSWENSVAHPNARNKTIVVGMDDSTPGQVYVYVGDKQRKGNPVEQAGLQGGKLYGIKVIDGGANYGGSAAALENGGAINGKFVLEDVSDVATGTGAVLQTTSVARQITEFARPEDGHWDTEDTKVFYFVTTGAAVGGQTQTARLYKLSFDSLRNPAGGTIELVVDSASLTGGDGEIARSFDNITVDDDGQVLIQEDPGNSAYIAKTWRVDPAKPLAAVQIFESDRNRFLLGARLS